MPITKSAKKSLKVSRTRQSQNYKSKVALDKALKNVDGKNINQTVATIDKAAKTGIIHKNKAARLKSALSKKYPTIVKSQKSKVKSQNEKVKVKKKTIKKTVVKK